jgi:hypothetical protein
LNCRLTEDNGVERMSNEAEMAYFKISLQDLLQDNKEYHKTLSARAASFQVKI